jgi:hypothetical protein
MNTQFLKDHWAVIRAKLRGEYPNLTENDLAYIAGREEEVFERVERRTGLKREQIVGNLLEKMNFA